MAGEMRRAVRIVIHAEVTSQSEMLTQDERKRHIQRIIDTKMSEDCVVEARNVEVAVFWGEIIR